MPTYLVNKVIYGNTELINLENDTVTTADVINGKRFHLASGASALGSCTYDADTKDATATVDDILYGKTAYKNGQKLTGSMPNIGTQTATLVSRDSAVSITAGYHDGSGSIGLDGATKSALIADNIREGIQILGITGTMSGSEDVKATNLVATPYTTSKTYLPTDLGDFNYFAQAAVSSIAYSTVLNAAGGYTATIGTVAP